MIADKDPNHAQSAEAKYYIFDLLHIAIRMNATRSLQKFPVASQSSEKMMHLIYSLGLSHFCFRVLWTQKAECQSQKAP